MINKLRLKFWDWVWDDSVINRIVPTKYSYRFHRWVIDKGEEAYKRVHGE